MADALPIIHGAPWRDVKPEVGRRLKQKYDGGAQIEFADLFTFHDPTTSAVFISERLVAVRAPFILGLRICLKVLQRNKCRHQ